ncbi:hypothetical protein ED312_04125 [Sinomicrobium pectinilyticum]|uniref:Uncharacterized protein n=1 Tax=Sinomicrobium pectinilyticum TaxID=1084421 RepID=A0A3N0EV07_SINP1|nr:hypothetical protein ED312_04125 [Sinomicrobium pectinilyticum]
MEILASYIKYIALLSAIIATITYPKYIKGRAKYFLYSIWLIAVTEFAYKFVYYKILDGKYPVFFIANIYSVLQFLFYFFWYRYLINALKLKRLLLIFALLFALFVIWNSIFLQDFVYTTQTYTYIVGTIFTIVSIYLYFVQVFNDDFILHFQRSVYFWFSLGILLFFIPFLPFMIASEFFNYEGSLFSLVIFILNVVMHSCFVIGVLWSKKKYNY